MGSAVIGSAQRKQRAQAVAEVFEFMRRRHLVLADLTEYGGEDFPNPELPERVSDPARVKNARAVERCWELIAQLGLTFETLESSSYANSATPTLPRPARPARTQRGEGGASKTSAFSATCEKPPSQTKPSEINDLANSTPVGGPDPNPEGAPCRKF